ncbi:MAG: glycosyltransferase family 4 protein [Acidobacteriaceae bacterium]
MPDSKRLRITVLTDVFLPHAGGSRFYYYNLFRRIAIQDDVTLMTTKVSGWEDFDAREQTPSFRIRRRFSPIRNLSYLQLPKLVGTALRALRLTWNRPDVLHCGDLYPPGLIGVMVKRAIGIPFVAYSHGEDFTLTQGYKYQPKVRDLIYHCADAVIANGSFSEEKLLQSGVSRHKIFKITPGLDPEVFFPQPSDVLRQRYGLEKELIVLTIARLVPRKGHSRVIRALAALASEGVSFKYIIVGTGSNEDALRELAVELGVQDKVIFAGFIPDSELNMYYNLADVAVMPNVETKGGDIEGFGMVFLEANAAGKPVIGGRSGGTADAVIDGVTGYLVDPENDNELVERLRQLLTSEVLRKTMGSAGLRRVQAEFSWDSRAALLRRISADIAASSRIKHRKANRSDIS